MNTSILYVLCTLLMAFSSYSAKAQRLEPGFGFGASIYTGDITNGWKLKNFRPAGEILLRYNLSPAFSIRANLGYLKVAANDLDSKDVFQQLRGIKFNADIFELGARAEFNFIDFRAREEIRKVSPFFFLGMGACKIVNESNYIRDTARGVNLMIPFGIGFKYSMSYNWNLTMEVGARKTMTDQLDTIAEEKAGKFQMGNPFKKDMYYFSGFTLSYMFEGVICPIRFK